MTDTRAQHIAELQLDAAPHVRALTRRQISSIENLPADHEVLSVRGGAPLVRSPDGQLLRMRPSGRLVATIPVERVRSYLQVRG